MILELMLCILLSLIPATFNYFLDYCLGRPMSDEISIKAIFFPYSYWLAKKALPIKEQQSIVASLAPLLNSEDVKIRKQGKDQLKQLTVMAGREYFTYQQAIGMCPFCTNFWCSLIAATFFFFAVPMNTINPIFFFIFTPIFSHSILRKL